MKLFIVSMLLAAVYLGSCHRPTAGRRTSFVTRSQFARMCAEIVSIKERLDDQEQSSNEAENIISGLQQEVDELKIQNDILENKVISLEQAVDDLEIQINQPEVQSAFAIYGFPPDEPKPGVMTMSEDAVITNIGDDYDPETGQYTAPVDGTYIFDLNLYKKDDNLGFVSCYIRKNGENVAKAFIPGRDEGGEENGSVMTVLQLMENDIVDVGDCSDVGRIDNYTSFGGYLLKTD